jgi:hypothetical protein
MNPVPYKMSGTTVVRFSGGRTSAYMLRQVLDSDDRPSYQQMLNYPNTNSTCSPTTTKHCVLLRRLTDITL